MSPTLTAREAKGSDSDCTTALIAHTLRADGFDASEDGTGRGTPLVPVAFSSKDDGGDAGALSPTLRSMNHHASHANGGGQVAVAYQCHGGNVGPMGVLRAGNGDVTGGVPFLAALSFDWQKGSDRNNPRPSTMNVTEEQTGTLAAQRVPAVGVPLPFDTTQITSAANYFNPKPGDPCHPLAAGAHAPAIAFQDSQSDTRVSETFATLDANYGPRRRSGIISPRMAVRRITPEEAEALQGFPRRYTAIPWRGKPADQCPDGPRYHALGNIMAVPCMRWIGERIAAVDALLTESDSLAA